MRFEQPFWKCWLPLAFDDLSRMGCPLGIEGCCIRRDWAEQHTCPYCLGDWVCETCMFRFYLCDPNLDWDLLGWSSDEDSDEVSTTRAPNISDMSISASRADCSWSPEVTLLVDAAHGNPESPGSTCSRWTLPTRSMEGQTPSPALTTVEAGVHQDAANDVEQHALSDGVCERCFSFGCFC